MQLRGGKVTHWTPCVLCTINDQVNKRTVHLLHFGTQRGRWGEEGGGGGRRGEEGRGELDRSLDLERGVYFYIRHLFYAFKTTVDLKARITERQ